MTNRIPTLFHHLSIGVSNLDRALRFYDAVFATLGGSRQIEHEFSVGYGKHWPEFYVCLPLDTRRATPGNGTHFAFIAPSEAAVRAFYATALANGGVGEGEPGPRSGYGPGYYGAFVRDPDGNKLEAAVIADWGA